MRGAGWEDDVEGQERMDFIKTARPLWMNLNVSGTGRLDEFFDHTTWNMKNSNTPLSENSLV